MLNPQTAVGAGRRGERGVALIITLILLSVITFMAVTFLVLSQSERAAVSTSTDMMIAREAANAALERARAEVLASVVAFTNYGGYDLLVSTNFVNRAGYQSGLRSYTNVSFSYANGAPLNASDWEENLSHLLYNPRPPVFVTNRLFANSNEFRFYLDLNRNARFETNGYAPVINPNGGFYDLNYNPIGQMQPGNTLSNFFVGDPEWIGRLERVDLPHSSSNRFVYRYAYMVVPAGKTLDLNYIHNYSASPTDVMPATSVGGFSRNMGVGTWEINLAGFLTDLNTNYWPYPNQNFLGAVPYLYNFNNSTREVINQGVAFEDAYSLLRYRYQGTRFNLASVLQNFGNAGAVAFTRDLIDGYGTGPFVTTNLFWQVSVDQDNPNTRWAGSENPVQFFSHQDLFDKSKTALNPGAATLSFTDRLRMAGTNNDSYNRYTFYRMLSQLGTDTSVEPQADKIHINYDNLTQSNQFTLAKAATNFFAWRPVDFFTNTANRLLANAGFNQTALNVNFIPIYPTNYYTPSIHQMLQLAANIYDSTTNRVITAAVRDPAPPSVFRPLFGRRTVNGTTVVYISGYQEVTNSFDITGIRPEDYLDPAIPSQMERIEPFNMVHGVPLVIGAKKGFPNFNELGMETAVQVSRKLEFRRPNPNAKVNETNIMYTLSISNIIGVEAWNSYSNAYPRPLDVRVTVDMFAVITNEMGTLLLSSTNIRSTPLTQPLIAANSWLGWQNENYAQDSFRLPLNPETNLFAFLTPSVWHETTKRLLPLQNQLFERHPNNAVLTVPRWSLLLRTRMRYVAIDTAADRIVDYVNIDSTETPLDIAALLAMDGNCSTMPDMSGQDGSMWCTNRYGGATLSTPTVGMLNQINASLGIVEPQTWNGDPQLQDRFAGIDFFRAQFDLSPRYNAGSVFSKTNVFYTPYVPARTIHFTTELQANDPLVHYTLGDLRDLFDNFNTNRIQFVSSTATNNLGRINKRYEPWNGNPLASSKSLTARDVTVKDPMVRRSDDWVFPTNKFPSIGWLGRVHRGTPWQTINLKSADKAIINPRHWAVTNTPAWQQWSGNGVFVRNDGQFNTNVVPLGFITNDAAFTHPINDRYILDLFTTALNDNATRGQLSINQTNLAAWSAVLSGVSALENNRTNVLITPAGAHHPTNLPPVARIVRGIQNAMQASPGGTFYRLGDILAVPELTLDSPVLNSGYSETGFGQIDMDDMVYERIPQQVLGLLKGPDDPRFVIYTWGQCLKPAERSLLTSGPFFGMCTNYQVTAEVATRTVVRVEGTPEYPRPLSAQPPLPNLRPVVESFNLLPPE